MTSARLAAAFLLCTIIPFISGCWDRTEVNDLALIMAAGMDAAPNGKVELSVQVYTPNQSRTSSDGEMMNSGNKGDMVIVKSAIGTDLADAAQRLQEEMPRKVFWGHSEVFIAGEELAKRGILDQVDFLFRHPQPREHAYFFVSKGRAKNILSINTRMERDSAETLRELTVLSGGMGLTLKDLSGMLTGRSKALVVPLVGRKEEAGGSNTYPYINGAAVLIKGKMTGQYQGEAKRYVQIIRNELESTTVTFPIQEIKGKGGGVMSVRLIKCHTKLIPTIRRNQWSILVRIHGEASVLQNESHVNVMLPNELPRLEQQLNKEIESKVKETFRQIQDETHADIFGTGDAFWRKYPKRWTKEQSRWDEIFPEVSVYADSAVNIKSPGFAGKSYK
ncbi:spore germination protein KC [Paenibacillus rhizosphaerae]|uniref:Spore germination protein KC n=1 Tax=Paenibacillus rhizosphaerae TaxID=297318 RepID=A0A839TJ25_9BACL|nr:Ger(x)C family spore germination protein [Paenibacillus rhizosphaerae]MBB3126734.1 spore germination protein KC [Paenibacillus rhizosphaerae]